MNKKRNAGGKYKAHSSVVLRQMLTAPSQQVSATEKRAIERVLAKRANPRALMLFRTRAAALKYAREHGVKSFSIKKLKSR